MRKHIIIWIIIIDSVIKNACHILCELRSETIVAAKYPPENIARALYDNIGDFILPDSYYRVQSWCGFEFKFHLYLVVILRDACNKKGME